MVPTAHWSWLYSYKSVYTCVIVFPMICTCPPMQTWTVCLENISHIGQPSLVILHGMRSLLHNSISPVSNKETRAEFPVMAEMPPRIYISELEPWPPLYLLRVASVGSLRITLKFVCSYHVYARELQKYFLFRCRSLQLPWMFWLPARNGPETCPVDRRRETNQPWLSIMVCSRRQQLKSL